MALQQYPGIPWVLHGYHGQDYVAECTACGAAYTLLPHDLGHFAAEHQNHTGSGPVHLGDRVRAVTDALGIEACTPCEARRIWLNRVFG